jgi:hypothetical protein
VNSTPEAAYDYVADFTRHPEWAADSSDMLLEADRPGPTMVGSRYRGEGTFLRRRNRSVVTVTQLDRPHRVEFEAEDEMGITGNVITFEKAGDGTVISRQFYNIKLPWFAPIAAWVFKSVIDKEVSGGLAKLKAKLELPEGSAPPR